jgi:hypothetical protein
MEGNPLKPVIYQVVLAHLLTEGSGIPQRGSSRGKRSTRPAGTRDRLFALLDQQVFRQARSLGEIRRLLSERGWRYRAEDLGTPLTRLVQQGHLRRTAVMEGGKRVWKYSTTS